MLVANSFDLWQKDTFFSAAEEVQQSADVMESANRKWLRARREGLIPQQLDEIGRELQTALGTAKWQLEEFQRAVCQSYKNNSDDITVTRHRQFVSAIEDQISRVETALKESLKVDGKKPFQWVNLDDKECNDLAHFLSGTSRMIKDECTKLGSTTTRSLSQSNVQENCNFESDVSSKMQMLYRGESLEEILTSVGTKDEISYQDDQVTSSHCTWISADRNALDIVIDTDDRQMNASIEVTPKEKGSKPFFWRSNGKHCGGEKGAQTHASQMKMINWINNHLRGGHGSQRQHVSPVLPVKSIRFVLVFMLTIFLVVPFLIHSA